MKRIIIYILLLNLFLKCNSSWGTFTDTSDGTIKLSIEAGTYGKVTYNASTLYFAKCSYGQTYNSSTNSCLGRAIPVPFCYSADNSCNGGGTDNSLSKGPLFDACQGLNLSGKNGWRVPTKNELRLLIKCNDPSELPSDGNYCSNHNKPSIRDLFTSESDHYWSSSTYAENLNYAWGVDFNYGYVVPDSKTDPNYVRCVTEQ